MPVTVAEGQIPRVISDRPAPVSPDPLVRFLRVGHEFRPADRGSIAHPEVTE